MKKAAFVFGLVFISTFNFLSATELKTFPHSKARVLTNKKSVSENTKELVIALEIYLDEGWHTYWQNPGDSGSQPRIEIKSTQSKISHVSDINWPTPTRLDYPPLTSFSYENHVLLEKLIQLEKVKGKALDLEISAEWLVCKVECIPAFGDFRISIPVNINETDANEKIFQDNQKKFPHDQWLYSKFKQDAKQIIFDIPKNFNFLDFFPLAEQGLDNAQGEFNSSSQQLKVNYERQTLPHSFKGLLLTQNSENIQSHWIEFKQETKSWIHLLFFAFLGGLILNLMPCVLPILSLKAFSLIKQSQQSLKQVRLESIFYSLGVVCMFLLIAIILQILRAQGEALGWGFQLQEPGFVAFMAILFLVLALNFLGLYEFQLPGMSLGTKNSSKSPYLGSFLTGLLAVLVSSPCTAPFMGAAMGFALTQPLLISLSIFTALALGFAGPFLLMSIAPQSARYLPKPGPWLANFKVFLFFPMLLTLVWLLSVFADQMGTQASSLLTVNLVFLAFGVWLQSLLRDKLKTVVWLITVGLSIYSTFKIVQMSSATNNSQISIQEGLNWEVFDANAVQEALAKGESIFVNFTASWCLSCKVNEKLVFNDEEVQGTLKDRKIRTFKADWTNRAAHITQELEKHNRFSVPLYLFYKNGNPYPLILPEVLTPSVFLQKIAPESL